jgi:hypothetical protein
MGKLKGKSMSRVRACESDPEVVVVVVVLHDHAARVLLRGFEVGRAGFEVFASEKGKKKERKGRG